jgi:hypothetical protein
MGLSRHELQDIWRQRVWKAWSRYVEASDGFRIAWDEHAELRMNPDGALAIRIARQAESEALAEYMRTLKIYTDLVLNGTVPPEENSD